MTLDTQYLLWTLAAAAVLTIGGFVAAMRLIYRVLRAAEDIKDQVLGDEVNGVPSLRAFRLFVTNELSYNSGKSLKDQVRKISNKLGAEE